MQSMSCFDGMYKAWGRMIAAQGVAVVMVDFRNAHAPVLGARGSPVPGRPERLRLGRQSGSRAMPMRFNIDPERIVVAGESGGGNLTLATGLKLQAQRRHRPDQGALRALSLHCRPVAACRRTRRRPKTTASCSSCTTTAGRWPTASRPFARRTLWPGRASRPRPT